MDEPEFTPFPQASAEARPVAPPLPFSQQAIWGFVISCVSLFVFGFLGLLGVLLASRGFRAASQGRARGRGLAIAGMIVGTVGFLFYAVMFWWSHFA
ncbi:DUF4190 domain-containing protein [Leifsonia shinshuensis]|uniref:DUF4190 domain-containing protein n=1 Tax=Leifsonia shinshuensis TaxID=150026 RepID=A0A7G6YFD3_9MICO|nr:DUF4190 domain-containing protein [Leifsonia shinshuensis]QNE37198.1 DUF4190 domain-containing protein [Leifsonia shinshuensis]